MKTSMDPYSQVWEYSPCQSGPGLFHLWSSSHLGEPNTFGFVLGEPASPGGSPASPPLYPPSRNSGISSTLCAKLPLSQRARCPLAASTPSAGDPCVPRNSASWASWCVPPASPPQPHAGSTTWPWWHLLMAPLSLVSLLMLMDHHAVSPFCSLGTPEQRVLWSCWDSKANPVALLGRHCCSKNKAAAAKLHPLCPRTTATQQRICAVPHQDSLPWITWCISPGTPLMPTAGWVLCSPRELPGGEVLVDLHLLFLSL